MDSKQTKGLNPRALTALLLLSAGLAAALTGLWLSLTRQACQVRHVHLATALVFVASAVWHASYNLKPLISYLLSREGRGGLRLEARLALAITAIGVLIGVLWAPGRLR